MLTVPAGSMVVTIDSRITSSTARENEVANDVVTMFAEDRLGVKLNSEDGARLVPDTHNDVIIGAGCGHVKALGKSAFRNDQRMITRDVQWVGTIRKEGRAVVRDRTRHAVPWWIARDFGAECGSDRLMSQAYTEDR